MSAALIAAWLIGCGFFAYCIITAPLGFEDARGFHYGEPNEPQAALDTPRVVNCAPGHDECAGGAFVDSVSNHGENNG